MRTQRSTGDRVSTTGRGGGSSRGSRSPDHQVTIRLLAWKTALVFRGATVGGHGIKSDREVGVGMLDSRMLRPGPCAALLIAQHSGEVVVMSAAF